MLKLADGDDEGFDASFWFQDADRDRIEKVVDVLNFSIWLKTQIISSSRRK
eukprot:TRINITY_DN4735_c0_g1_i1.p4 TRINITY_DN4735_c0_g1~~TRINITY_DN4735_c0_g1_i1.p4  ORF type:complete len:51 (-),score=17.52 TRINITY_DN4735_c0_g1_i1:47-199(-)